LISVGVIILFAFISLQGIKQIDVVMVFIFVAI
ncbi:unnamed protein product, partial [marine sediment metagenome]